jgi:hypothetical protein
VGVGVGEGVGLGVTVGEAVALGVGLPLACALGDGVGIAVPAGVGVPLGLGDGGALGASKCGVGNTAPRPVQPASAERKARTTKSRLIPPSAPAKASTPFDAVPALPIYRPVAQIRGWLPKNSFFAGRQTRPSELRTLANRTLRREH